MTYLDVLNNTSQRQPNTMAAGISSMILHIRKENIKQSLSDLNTIGHRQQYIATINGVMYYDDSRAENVNATWFTFENIISPVIWIAGGNGSGSDFSDLKRIAKKKKVKALICIGKDNTNLKTTFRRDIKDIYEADSLKNAVNMAALMAKADDIVLFSPACKSDNEKETYIERGNQYLETVKQLENERHQ
jgi:UDP-N-acetylmuramoylalanine--D-glutamate ligase